MKKYAVIAAGGSGQRMGNAVPKQFLEINGRSILWYSVKAFIDTFDDILIIVVAPAANINDAKNVLSAFPNISFVEGGATRFQSVKNGLNTIKDESIIFVHDAVRCLITKELLERCYNQAVEKGSAIPAIPINDSIRMINENGHKVMNRDTIRIIQTPQTFKNDVLLAAFNVEYNEKFTDEATVVEASGTDVYLVEGEQTNIKITRRTDLSIAASILSQRSSL